MHIEYPIHIERSEYDGLAVMLACNKNCLWEEKSHDLILLCKQ